MANLPASCIYVLAGTNGAGKSSVLGEMLLDEGIPYFNPDVATTQILTANPGVSLADANSAAWNKGKLLLERAIAERGSLAFETTLGGNTITRLLERALSEGLQVRMWYVGLSSPELHLKRVRSRVQHGGHDIPESKVRQRYTQSRLNLVRLIPNLTELRVYDNSADADPKTGHATEPELMLHMSKGKVVSSCGFAKAPAWMKSILAAALGLNK